MRWHGRIATQSQKVSGCYILRWAFLWRFSSYMVHWRDEMDRDRWYLVCFALAMLTWVLTAWYLSER